MAGDPWCPYHGQTPCRCTPAEMRMPLRFFDGSPEICEGISTGELSQLGKEEETATCPHGILAGPCRPCILKLFVEKLATDGFGIPLPQGCSKWGTGEWMSHINVMKTALIEEAKKVLGWL